MPLSHEDLQSLATATKIPLKGIQAVASLMSEGATVPFIARYRKDATGGLDEVQVRDVVAEVERRQALNERRNAILKLMAEHLTPTLKQALLKARTKTELEDIYLPFKPRRRTRALQAREAGLEPLAKSMRYGDTSAPEILAQKYVKGDITDASKALQGARDIVAETFAEHQKLREIARDVLWHQGILTSKAVSGSEDHRFEDYKEFKSGLNRLPSHRFLALKRGEEAKALRLKITLEPAFFLSRAERYLKINTLPSAQWREQVETALADSWKRLLKPALETEIFQELKSRSDTDAIQIFSRNLESLLMAAPLGTRSVMALDPGLRTGIKCAMLSKTGRLEDFWVLHSTRQPEAARELFLKKWQKHRPDAIAIGDGTGSREAEKAVREWLANEKEPPLVVRVSESGASIYSASDIAREEFPELDLTFRGAVSIGRRLQDPLAELVKIPPKSLGVGQYQHDVNQKALQQQLNDSVESCVNRVGVELNTASVPLLTYVAGLSQKVAENIVTYRDAQGPFVSRKALKKVKGLGPKAYEQSAGFLRIREATQVLDQTAVHPEQYETVEKIARDIACSLPQLVKAPEQYATKLRALDLKQYTSDTVGHYALRDILEELKKPGRDPRDTFQAPTFSQSIQNVEDLKTDMVLEGRVTNITAFGAFVDIGVHQDGLVHISQLAEGFVKDPQDVVSQGQTLKVKVLDVDLKRRRIQLSARV